MFETFVQLGNYFFNWIFFEMKNLQREVFFLERIDQILML